MAGCGLRSFRPGGPSPECKERPEGRSRAGHKRAARRPLFCLFELLLVYECSLAVAAVAGFARSCAVAAVARAAAFAALAGFAGLSVAAVAFAASAAGGCATVA